MAHWALSTRANFLELDLSGKVLETALSVKAMACPLPCLLLALLVVPLGTSRNLNDILKQLLLVFSIGRSQVSQFSWTAGVPGLSKLVPPKSRGRCSEA